MRDRSALPDTYVQKRGSELYRGFLIEWYFVKLDGVDFFRVDARQPGLDKAEPMFMLQSKTTDASIEKLVREMKGLVGHVIHQGVAIPATTIPEQAGSVVDKLIMRSKSGKPAICKVHWKAAKILASEGKASLIIVGMLTMQRFTAKLQSDGLLLGPKPKDVGYTLNLAWDAYAPLCCWLGDDVFATILADSNPSTLLDRARAKGVL